MTILIFFIVLASLILVHEFGHFIIAKKAGIQVDEFGLGFPPRLWSKKIGETEYSLNLIPFGGFVKIYGETAGAESVTGPNKAKSLTNKSKWIQAAVLTGGVFFNFLLAWFLLAVGFSSGLPAAVGLAPTDNAVSDVALTVVQVRPDSPADLAGIRPGDKIVSLISGTETLEPTEPALVQSFIRNQPNRVININLKRGNENVITTVTPIMNLSGGVPGEPAIGISMEKVGIVSLPPHLAIIESAKYTVNLTVVMVFILGQILVDLFTGAPVADAIVGPVGIVGLVGNAADLGLIYLLTFTAIISINLAIINLIPFPALDGGRLLFLLIETIKGSPIKPKIANSLNLVGFSLLILLMVIITYNDIVRLF